jgi:hypothetical protein
MKTSTINNTMNNKTKRPTSNLITLVTLFIAAVLFAGCNSSKAASENRNLNTAFYGLILKSNARVVLTQGMEPSVRIEGDERSVTSVQTTIENGALIINGKNDLPVIVYVTAGEISLIEVEGNGTIISNQPVYSDILLLKVVGSGTIRLDVRSLSIGMIVRGSGKIYAKGSTGDSYIRVTGSGEVYSMNLDSFKTTTEANAESSAIGKVVQAPAKHQVLKLHQY